MKNLILFLAIFSSLLIGNVIPDNAEKDAIKNVINTAYVEGLQNEGDIEKIKSGFHPEFKLLGVNNSGELWTVPIDQWAQSALKRREKGELPRTKENLYRVEYENIDINGNAAVAKLKCYIGKKLTYIDYISLYKLEDGWKIVNKIFNKVK